MATTGARRSRRDPVPGLKGSPAPIQFGILWGYPFSLVRRLFIAFVCLLALCFAGAYILSQPTDPLVVLIHLIPVALAILIAMYVAELVGVTERPRPPLGVEALFWAIATSCLVMAVGYAIVPTYAPSTMLACAAPVVATLAVFVQRKWQEAHGTEEHVVPAVIFAGSREEAAQGMAALADAPQVLVRAVMLPPDVTDRAPMAGLPVLDADGAVDRLPEMNVRFFVVADAPTERLREILAPCAGVGCVVETVGELVARSQGRVNLTSGDDIALLNRLTTQANRFSIQRFVDLVLVHLCLPVAIVPFLVTVLLVRFTSPGPVFFRQKRVGRWGREFTLVKFRTMRADAEKETGPVWATEDDPRVTSVGRFLRRSRLDEIPQLWNVLRGEMSLVGPRPERRHFVDALRRQIPLYDARHSVRPGLTGWAQIRYNYGADVDDARTKLGYELFYILNRSLTFYFTILLETVKVLLFQRGSR